MLSSTLKKPTTINREKLIEVLVKYKVNPYIINMIIQMYEGDKTTIHLGRLKKIIEVTIRIRQGCSISTLLFKMVTFTIIEQLNEQVESYKIGAYKGNSLWLADDAVLIANSEKTLLKALEVLEIEGKKNGLELSEEKTKILKVRGPENENKTHIGKFKIEKETKYLGIQLGRKGSNIFAAENKLCLQKAEKYLGIQIGGKGRDIFNAENGEQTHIGKFKIEKETKYLGIQLGGKGKRYFCSRE